MLFSTSVLLGLVAAAQASPLAARSGESAEIVDSIVRDEHGEIESFKNATALGVDIYDDIPTEDAERVDDHWVAEPGTKAWAWMRAQVDIDWDSVPQEKRSEMEKRQGFASIGIGMWAQDNCTLRRGGGGRWAEDFLRVANETQAAARESTGTMWSTTCTTMALSTTTPVCSPGITAMSEREGH